ncbi:MAG: hypothetical protein ACTTJX_02620 [Fusobacterium sp.]|jgi:hypothetical protein|uniref:hypothetical protein n=1 Tax=Fusobacterium sp. TaxID=68766 RepID=UPI003FA0CFA6
MAIIINEPFNNINLIIRPEKNIREFYLDSDNKIERMIFYFFFQSFNIDEYQLEIFLTFSAKENPEKKDLRLIKLTKYKVSREGFFSLNKRTVTKEKKNLGTSKIGLTMGYRSDLELDMSGIELKEGIYEINAALITKEDKLKLLSLCPFKVTKK